MENDVAKITEKELGKFVLEFKITKLIDAYQVKDLRELLTQFADKKEKGKNRELVMDFSNVEFFSSGGMVVMRDIDNKLRLQQENINALACLKPEIFEIFFHVRHHLSFNIQPTVKDAFASIDGRKR